MRYKGSCLAGSEHGIGTYTFNNHVIMHWFCQTCGASIPAENTAENEREAYVNVRCLEGIDPASFPMIQFDGRSM